MIDDTSNEDFPSEKSAGHAYHHHHHSFYGFPVPFFFESMTIFFLVT
jgi:hypothetical protein